MNISNLVKRMDLRRANTTLAAMPWIPRALQPHPEPRAVPSARPASSRRGIRLAPLLLAAGAVLAETSTPVQTAQAHEKDDHTHGCTSPPAESCPGYDDVVPAEITVWSATMTVGTRMSGGITYYGWSDVLSYTGASLTDDEFTFGGDTYEIDYIFLLGDALFLQFDSSNPGDIAKQATRDKLTLQVGSDSFNLGAGTLQDNQRTINWLNTGLSWAAGDSVQVKLTATPPPNAVRLQDHLERVDDGGATSKSNHVLRTPRR